MVLVKDQGIDLTKPSNLASTEPSMIWIYWISKILDGLDENNVKILDGLDENNVKIWKILRMSEKTNMESL